MKTLAERLAWARAQKEWSQEELAARAGVAQSTIGNLEAGIRASARKLPQIAHALEVDALWLADGVGTIYVNSVKRQDSPTSTLTVEEVTRVITGYGKLSEANRRLVIDFIDNAVRNQTPALAAGNQPE